VSDLPEPVPLGVILLPRCRAGRPFAGTEHPALAEENGASADDARPSRHAFRLEAGEVSERLESLLSDGDEERDDPRGIDAARDDGDDLEPSRRPVEDEAPRRALEADPQVPQMDDL